MANASAKRMADILQMLDDSRARFQGLLQLFNQYPGHTNLDKTMEDWLFALNDRVYNSVLEMEEDLGVVRELALRATAKKFWIDRLPDELLQEIFRIAFAQSAFELEDPTTLYINLSHVCRRWGKIIFETRDIWSKPSISLKMEQERLVSYWKYLLKRFRHDDPHWYPLTLDKLILRDISPESIHKLPILLNTRITVGALTLQMTGDIQLRPLIDAPTKMRCETMELFGNSNYEAGIDLGILQPILAGCTELKIEGIDSLLIHPALRLPTLHELWLTGIKYAPIDLILDAFPNLRILRTDYSNVSVLDHLATYIHPQLTKLTILDESPAWMRFIHFPNLQSLCLCTTRRTPDEMDFLLRHQTIKNLAWSDYDTNPSSNLDELIDCARNVSTLRTNKYIPQIGDWTRYGLSSPPFPHLEGLFMFDELSTEAFEQLVRRRCLPKSHPESELPGNLEPLKALYVISMEDVQMSGTLADGLLTSSEYYDSRLHESWTKLSWL